MRSAPRLVFVYNADSGFFNLLTDAAHKILSPRTYQCNLCTLTHGHLGPKRRWTEFIRSLPFEAEFLHADEFRSRYAAVEQQFPAVFVDAGGDLSLLIDAAAINEARCLDELEGTISTAAGRVSNLAARG